MTLQYNNGFGNEFESEAIEGALPRNQFSPQRCPLGLYAEKFSTTSFVAPRARNRRTWMYRILPSVGNQHAFEPIDRGLLRSAPLIETQPLPDQLRWDPPPLPESPTTLIDGLMTVCANGNLALQIGGAVHLLRREPRYGRRLFL